MARTVLSRVFMLRSCELTAAHQQGLTQKVFDKYFPGKSAGADAPVALRWVSNPFYGFSRQPFNIYRRPRNGSEVLNIGDVLLPAPLNVNGTQIISWANNPPMFEVVFKLKPNNSTMLVRARDSYGYYLPDQQVSLNAAGWGRFRTPGIVSLEVSGVGQVEIVRGIDGEKLANMAGWTLTQVVGLPYTSNEILPPAYQLLPQGYNVANQTGDAASLMRLEIARILQLSLPAVPFAGIQTPAWAAPDAAKYLTLLRKGNSGGVSMLAAITSCLKNTDDTLPTKLQKDYRLAQQLPGFKQQGQNSPPPDPNNKSDFKIPVVGVTMLGVGSESYAATGLGYGTVDFPSLRAPDSPLVPPPNTNGTITGGAVVQVVFTDPAGYGGGKFDYMATGQFVGAFGIKWELAALATPLPDPVAPQKLTAKSLYAGRPALVDLPSAETVKLEWSLTPQPQAFGVAVKRAGQAATQILNEPRGAAGGFYPYVPARPAPVNGQMPPDQTSAFFDGIAPLPFENPATSNYLLIGVDVFGRWSSWSRCDYTAQPQPVQQPGVTAVDFYPYPNQPGPVVKGQLTLELSWDWTDRSPDRIELTAAFFNNNQVPQNPPAAGFPLAAGAPNPKTLKIVFPVNNNPTPSNPVLRFDPVGKVILPSPVVPNFSAGTLESVPLDPVKGSDLRKYRLVLENFTCDFTNAAQVGFAVFARGTEAVRPTKLSAVVGPRVEYILDPTPPEIDFYTPSVLWTALPDVSDRARVRLDWGAQPKAVEYMVWESTETALLSRLKEYDKELIPDYETKPIWERADLLKARIETEPDDFWGFTRLKSQGRIVKPTFDVTLPGSADILYLYRISAVSKNNMDSGRSSKSFAVAVPHRNEPGAPRLMTRVQYPPAQSGGVKLIVVPAQLGVEPVGYRVFRVQRETLARDLGLMGAPVYNENATWDDEPVSDLSGTHVEQGHSLLDLVKYSWLPYYYRVQAIGEHDPPYGEYRGESAPSRSEEIFYTPPDPPQLVVLSDFAEINVDKNSLYNHIKFKTDLPTKWSPLGWARVEIVETQPTPQGRIVRKMLYALSFDKLQQDPMPFLYDGIVVPIPLNTFPQVKLKQLNPQTGMNEYFIRLPNIHPLYETVNKTQYDAQGNPLGEVAVQVPRAGIIRILRVIDPLGRVTEAVLPQKQFEQFS